MGVGGGGGGGGRNNILCKNKKKSVKFFIPFAISLVDLS